MHARIAQDDRVKRLFVEKARENGIRLIAASIIAVIRLRGEPIKPSPQTLGHDQ